MHPVWMHIVNYGISWFPDFAIGIMFLFSEDKSADCWDMKTCKNEYPEEVLWYQISSLSFAVKWIMSATNQYTETSGTIWIWNFVTGMII